MNYLSIVFYISSGLFSGIAGTLVAMILARMSEGPKK